MIKNLTKPLFLVFSLFAFSSAFAQAPNITYTTPQNYKLNTPIAPLAPNNTGGTVPLGEYGTVSTFAGTGQYGYTDGAANIASFKIPAGMVIDNDNNLYVADFGNEVIRKITPQGVVSTFVGSGSGGRDNGIGTQASFYGPSGMVIDPSGALYVTEQNGQDIRKVTAAREVSLLAGSGFLGKANGTGTAASFNTPVGIAMGPDHNLYVSDLSNYLIRKITANGEVTNFAGSGAAASANGSLAQASFGSPQGLAFDSKGNLYVCDDYSYTIRKIATDGTVTTFAGNGNNISIDGTGTAAGFTYPDHLVFDTNDDLFVSDANLIRKITPQGVVTTVAGSTSSGFVDGVGTAARFYTTSGLALDRNGFLFVGEVSNHLIRKITLTGYTINKPLPAGLVFDATTGIISGAPTALAAAEDYTITARNKSGIGSTAVRISVTDVGSPPAASPPVFTYNTPNTYTVGVPVTPLVPRQFGGAVPATGYARVSTFAGGAPVGTLDGQGTNALFKFPQGISLGNDGNLYIGDTENNRIRKITPDANVTTFAGSGVVGIDNGTGTSATLQFPHGSRMDKTGTLYFADRGNNRIRKISPTGEVTSYSGNGDIRTKDGPVADAGYLGPTDMVFDAAGNMFVTDMGGNSIRKITTDGIVSTFAGNAAPGSNDGLTTVASFFTPWGITIDKADNLYVADAENNLIRKITPAGLVSTLAGSGSEGTADGQGRAASFKHPSGITIDEYGNLFVTDNYSGLIRKVTQNGIVSTLAGNPTHGRNDDIGPLASFYAPVGIVYDKKGSLFVADANNHLIRKVSLNGYAIDKTLPAGLVFDNNTGIITGIPTAGSPATDYTVSAYNSAGSSSTVVNIEVKTNAVPTLAPNISYPTPQIYTINSTITTLFPENKGGDVQPGGYSIDKPLPAGLSFDANTGAISGTPTALSPATIYTISAKNAVSVSNATINIKVTDGLEPVAPIPDISYLTPQTLIKNNTIAPIVPTNKGGEVKRYSYGLLGNFAGTGQPGRTDGAKEGARFDGPAKVAADGQGNFYITDFNNYSVRKITSAGVVSTIAGAAGPGYTNGSLGTSQLQGPRGIVADKYGNVYVADTYAIRKINSSGVTSTLAGGQVPGYTDGTGTTARFDGAVSVAIDGSDNIYVIDQGNAVIRRVTPSGVVTTLAGNRNRGNIDGQGTSAAFNNPQDIIFANGALYVADYLTIRRITIDGLVSTIAGNGVPKVLNGPALSAGFGNASALLINTAGDIYVLDIGNNAANEGSAILRVIDKDNKVSTVDIINSNGDKIYLVAPNSLTVDKNGLIYIASGGNYIQTLSFDRYTIDKPLPAGLVFDTGTGIISGTPTTLSPPGDYTVKAYNASGSSSTIINLEVTEGLQQAVITFPVLSTVIDNNGNIKPEATSTNLELPVTYTSSNPDVAIITPDGLIHVIAVGQSVITATQAGNDKYNAPLPVTQTLTIKFVQELTFPALTTRYVTDADFSPAATSNSDKFPVTYTSSNPAVATIVNGNVHIIGPGNTTITASQDGNDVYTKPSPVSHELTVLPDFEFGPISAKTTCTPDFDPGATSIKPITYTSSNQAVATIINGQIHVLSAGTSSITAASNGKTLSQPLTVNPTLQPTISVSTSTPLPACAGISSIFFQAFTTNEGLNAVYQWQVNSINVGTNNAIFSSTSLANGDVVTCTLTKTDACPGPVSVGSVPFTVSGVITPITPAPTVSISASVNNVYSGTPVTFTAAATNTAQVTGYQWLVNGVTAGLNSATFTNNLFKNGDVVSCRVTYDACTVQAVSNDVTLTLMAPPSIHVPNSFTPNGDGINDTWNIPDLAFYPKCVVRIFSRYGTELIQSKGYSKPWDGTFSGKLLPAGVYYYIIDTKDGQPTLSGNVTILR